MDIVKLIDEFLENVVTGPGIAYTDQPASMGRGKGQPFYPFNGSLFFQKKESNVFVGLVHMKDGRGITVQLDHAIQNALKSLPKEVSYDQYCASGAVVVRKSGGNYHFEAASSGVDVLPRFMLKTKADERNDMVIGLNGSRTSTKRIRLYQHYINGRLSYAYDSGYDKIVTVNGTEFPKKNVPEWLEASLEHYWKGTVTPHKEGLFAVPPAYWGSEDKKTDMRFIILHQYWTAAKALADAAQVKLQIKEPTLEFEGFWAPYELRPAVKVAPAPPVVLPKIVVPAVAAPPRVLVAIPVLPK